MIKGICVQPRLSACLKMCVETHLCLAVLFCCLMLGCGDRTISITSSPSGALVWVNDREVGRTPVQIGFIYDGQYDVRIERDGYEPIMTARWSKSDNQMDKGNNVVAWYFELEARNDDPILLRTRANTLRNFVDGNPDE